MEDQLFIEDFNNNVESLYKRLSEAVGVDIVKDAEDADKEMKENGSCQINMTKYGFQKVLLEAHNLIQKGKHETALVSLINNFDEFMSVKQVMTQEDIKNNLHHELTGYFDLLKEIISLYESYEKGSFKEFASKIKGIPFFNQEDFDIEKTFSPQVQIYVNRAIEQGLFKVNNYIKGTSEMAEGDAIIFYPQIGISEDITTWLNFLKQQSDFHIDNPDKIVATLFLKLDDIEPHFSYFIITLHKGDSIWLVSDGLEFDNPYNRKAQAQRGRSSGKIARRKEAHYENIGLPYQFAFEISELQKENKSLVSSKYFENVDLKDKWKSEIEKRKLSRFDDHDEKYELAIELVKEELDKRGIYFNTHTLHDSGTFHMVDRLKGILFKMDGRKVAYFRAEDDGILMIYKVPEVHFRKIADLDSEEKYYYSLLVLSLIENIIKNPPTQTVLLAEQFIEQKLLTGEKFDPVEDGFEGHDKDNKDYIEFLLESVGRKETALAKRDYSVVKANVDYDKNWLATPEKLENIAKWCVLDSERMEVQNLIFEKAVNKKEDRESLQKIFSKKTERIIDLAFMAKKIRMRLYKPENFGTGGGSRSVVNDFSNRFENKKINTDSYRRVYHSFSVGKETYEKEMCSCCGRYYSLNQIKFHIRHVDQFVYLLGLKDRFELPAYYQNYKAHNFVPYHGNSILGNTHPYSRLYDPCSHSEPNGINVIVYLCSKCTKNKSKDKPEALTIDHLGNVVDASETTEIPGIRITH